MKTTVSAKVDEHRRRFMTIGATAGGGLLFGFSLYGCNKDGDRKAPPSEKAVGAASTAVPNRAPGLAQNAFIRIERDGIVTMVVHKVEMGQGTWTSMPMLLAEELGIDLAKVKLEQAPANNNLYSDPLLGGQVTGGTGGGRWPRDSCRVKPRDALRRTGGRRVETAGAEKRDPEKSGRFRPDREITSTPRFGRQGQWRRHVRHRCALAEHGHCHGGRVAGPWRQAQDRRRESRAGRKRRAPASQTRQRRGRGSTA